MTPVALALGTWLAVGGVVALAMGRVLSRCPIDGDDRTAAALVRPVRDAVEDAA